MEVIAALPSNRISRLVVVVAVLQPGLRSLSGWEVSRS
jgi:hypothetical protein